MLPQLRHYLCRRLDQVLRYRNRLASRGPWVVCYGNCQMQPIAQMLLANRDFRRRFRLLCLPPVHELQPHQGRQVLRAVQAASVLIHQPVQEGYRDLAFSGSEFLRRQLSPGAIALAFPSLYFWGYSPEVIYIRRPDGQIYPGPAGDYHNRYILEGVLEKQPLQTVLDRLAAVAGIDPDFSRQVAENSLLELSRREQPLEIQIVPWLRQHWQQQRLFWTPNHPSRALLEAIAQQLLFKLGCDPRQQSRFAQIQMALLDEPLGESSFPIHPATYVNLGLRFPNPELVIRRHQPQRLVAMVEEFYRYYAQHPEVLESYRLKLIH